jgi:hypothetical protein
MAGGLARGSRRWLRLCVVHVAPIALASIGGESCTPREAVVAKPGDGNGAVATGTAASSTDTNSTSNSNTSTSSTSTSNTSMTSSAALASLGSTPPTCSTCGPAPLYPTGQCPDGLHVSGRGPCTKFADGSCHWTHLVCPPAPGSKAASVTCTVKECGPPAIVSQWLCPDGVHTGEFGPCVGTDQGQCGWTHRPCAGVAQGAGAPPIKLPPPAPTTSPFHVCKDLPGDAELLAWEVHAICPPGTGPAQPDLKVLRQFGDGTFVVQGPYGCYRARYRKCTSK